MAGDSSVMVFAEQADGRLADVGLELLSKARELADALGVSVSAVVAGRGVGDLADELAAYGAETVYVVDDERLGSYTTLPFARALVEVARRAKPHVLLFGATLCGRDLAPRVASALRAGLTADCTDLKIGDYVDPASKREYKSLLYQIRPAFGGNVIATIVNPLNWPQMATVREGVMRKAEPVYSRKAEVVRIAPTFDDADLVVSVLESVRADKKVDLKQARVIVSGGAGVGSADNFRLIFDLAHALGGTVGASRAAVDAGFVGKEHQVGQTGTTVRPKLYIACGISGQVQHRSGMQESGKIIAVNTDPNAPIFSIAHYGIVGDLCEVVPKIIDAYHKKT